MKKSLMAVILIFSVFAVLGMVWAVETNNVYGFKVRTIEGKPTTLGQYKGKILLIVNVASKCGFTPQYAGLEKIYLKYKERGLVILGFPCNQFGSRNREQRPR